MKRPWIYNSTHRLLRVDKSQVHRTALRTCMKSCMIHSTRLHSLQWDILSLFKKQIQPTEIKIYKSFIVISQSLFTQEKHRQDQSPSSSCTTSVHLVETYSRHWVVKLVVITMTRKNNVNLVTAMFCYKWQNTIHFKITEKTSVS